jgi:hypothetical protein
VDGGASHGESPEPKNLEQVIDRLEQARGDGQEISIGEVLESIGGRSFGPLLVVVGLIAMSPLSGIPGLPTTIAVIVLVIAAQLLFHRKHFWLPQWVLRRTLARSKLEKALKLARPPARFVDRLLKPRLKGLTHRAGYYVISLLVCVVAASMPPLELLPFAATLAGAALAAFGLALISEDGLLGIIAIGLTATVIGFGVYQLL